MVDEKEKLPALGELPGRDEIKLGKVLLEPKVCKSNKDGFEIEESEDSIEDLPGNGRLLALVVHDGESSPALILISNSIKRAFFILHGYLQAGLIGRSCTFVASQRRNHAVACSQTTKKIDRIEIRALNTLETNQELFQGIELVHFI